MYVTQQRAEKERAADTEQATHKAERENICITGIL